MTSGGGKNVAVIGAGLGGISAAISLAARGYHVSVYEKNEHVGGKLNLLKKDGFQFDLGPSILTLPAIFERLFEMHHKQMSDYVNICTLEPQWRNFFEDGTQIDLYSSVEETVAKNECLGESDRQELSLFMDYSKSLYEKVEPGYFGKGLDTVWQMTRYYGVLSSLRDFDLFRSMRTAVCGHLKNPHLQTILCFFIKYVGSSPYDAPAVLNLLPYIQSRFGLWYVRGGMFELARAIERLAKEVGVTVHYGREVVKILTDGESVTGIETIDGEGIYADIVVSNMEVIPACRDLLPPDNAVMRKLKKYEPACSGLVLHLGTDKIYPQLAHHNFFYSAEPRKHYEQAFHEGVIPEDPTLYVVAPTRTDATQAPEGCDNIKVLPHIPHLGWRKFGREEYLALRERVLAKMERMGLGDLRQHIIVEDMWTPEDIQRMYKSNCGAIYGVLSDRKKNLGFKAPKKSLRYGNLYFVGGSVNPGGGMPMAVLSGQQAAEMIATEHPSAKD